ncbi:MAG: efflux RND transporter periplasmic adaptor subunit [Deltaproteobacteria bacterium]|nr:efflux RND transporter periplasmic adaptor subunit [Deltaproteobacteria bacterium]
MKNIILSTLILLLITGAGAGGYYFGKGAAENNHPENEKKAEVTTKERKIKYWVAPMDPTFIRDEPGKSPMGMDLIPVYEDEGEEKSSEGLIRIDPITVQNMGVRMAVVKKRPLSRKIRTVGVVEYDEKSVIQVHSKVEGWIEKLYVDFTGKSVKKDEMLLEIYSPQLVSSQEEYLVALELKEKLGKSAYSEVAGGADSLLKSARKRLDYLDVPNHQIEELEKNRRILKTLHIHSPGKGIVTKKHIQEGGYVKPGMPIYTIADISKVWVHADIYESELPWVKTGQPVNMTLAYYPGKVFEGKVSYIYPFLEAKTRTIKVRLEFDNTDWQLKPDMYANIEIDSVISDNSIALPTEALIRSGERNVVITAVEKGKFLPKDVTIGIESGDGYYQVLEGLSDGETVVTSAQFLIDSESRLKEAISKMSHDIMDDDDMSDMDMSDMSLDDDMDMSEMTLE